MFIRVFRSGSRIGVLEFSEAAVDIQMEALR